jgi:hypothetical protein
VHSAFGVSQVLVHATGTGGSSQAPLTAPSGTLSQTKNGTNVNGSAFSSAQASFGVLRTYGDGRAVTRPNGLVYGNSVASFQDDMLIDAPGLTGTTGSVKIIITIAGTISSVANGVEPLDQYSYGFAHYQMSVNGGLQATETQQKNATGDPNAFTTSFFLDVEQEKTIAFTYGTPFTFKLLLQAQGAAYTNRGATSISDLSHTATWGGFGEVRDNQGATVTNYTASSTSGTNYTQPILPPQPVVVSRHIHTGIGPFDIPLPLTGTRGVESRTGGANGDHQIVLTFTSPITFTGASVSSGTGSVANSSGSGTSVVTLDLTGVAKAQTITVVLTGVNNGIPISDIAVQMGILLGDANGNGAVNATDVGQVKAQSGQPVTAANFRADLNANGALNATDVSTVKSTSGSSLSSELGGGLDDTTGVATVEAYNVQ